MGAYDYPEELESIIWNKETVTIFEQMYAELPEAFQPIWLEWAEAEDALKFEESKKQGFKFEPININNCEFMGFDDYGQLRYGWSYQFNSWDPKEGEEHTLSISLFYDRSPIERLRRQAAELKKENDMKQSLLLEKNRLKEIRKAELAAEEEYRQYRRLREKYETNG